VEQNSKPSAILISSFCSGVYANSFGWDAKNYKKTASSASEKIATGILADLPAD